MKLFLELLQPSQLYINRQKLQVILDQIAEDGWDSLDPVPVKELGNDLVLTDGHTRAFAHFILKQEQIEVVWEDEKLDWDLYKVCVSWCKDNEIYWVKNLQDRIIDTPDYELLWIERCHNLADEMGKNK